MATREKPWDVALSSATGAVVRGRRLNPDGVERFVGQITNSLGPRNSYPWGEMMDGDFFITAQSGSRNAQMVAFRQAAARHDMEISVSRWPMPDGTEGFRVIRVLGNISRVKKAARERGANAPSSDISAYYKRQAAWRRGEGRDSAPAMGVADTPSDPLPGGAGTAPAAPLGTGVQEREEREAKLAEARRRAKLELAGLDPDEDEDYMGVGDGTKIQSRAGS